METGKGRRWGATVFRGGEGEEVSSCTVSKVDDTTKSVAAAEVVEGSG
jgi:hypothetical protein